MRTQSQTLRASSVTVRAHSHLLRQRSRAIQAALQVHPAAQRAGVQAAFRRCQWALSAALLPLDGQPSPALPACNGLRRRQQVLAALLAELSHASWCWAVCANGPATHGIGGGPGAAGPAGGAADGLRAGGEAAPPAHAAPAGGAEHRRAAAVGSRPRPQIGRPLPRVKPGQNMLLRAHYPTPPGPSAGVRPIAMEACGVCECASSINFGEVCDGIRSCA
jgi:hypothetical protein